MTEVQLNVLLSVVANVSRKQQLAGHTGDFNCTKTEHWKVSNGCIPEMLEKACTVYILLSTLHLSCITYHVIPVSVPLYTWPM